MDEQSPYAPLESALGYGFCNRALLEQALTHRSYINETPGSGQRDNERLEFLGDAVLNLAVSEALMARFPQRSEGELTMTRAGLVSEAGLAGIAGAIGLGDWLFLGRGEQASGGRRKASLLADACEAVIGAVFLDGGYAAAALVVRRLFDALVATSEDPRQKDPKTRLQELVQARHREAPRYHLRAETGPDHDKRFHVALFIASVEYAEGEGRTKKEAEQNAAAAALARLAAEAAPG